MNLRSGNKYKNDPNTTKTKHNDDEFVNQSSVQRSPARNRTKRRIYSNTLSAQRPMVKSGASSNTNDNSNDNSNSNDVSSRSGRRNVGRVDYSQYFDDTNESDADNSDSDFVAESDCSQGEEDDAETDVSEDDSKANLSDYAWEEVKKEIVCTLIDIVVSVLSIQLSRVNLFFHL